jgi:hypothetical protein
LARAALRFICNEKELELQHVLAPDRSQEAAHLLLTTHFESQSQPRFFKAIQNNSKDFKSQISNLK